MDGDSGRITALAAAGCDTAAVTCYGQTGLMAAAASGSAAAVEAVLALDGTELDARDNYGGTAFLAACHDGSAECIAPLVMAGCDTAATTNYGKTGLIYAAASGSAAAVEAVLALDGTELEAQDNHGNTAFLAACWNGRAECIAPLVTAGCDAAATTNNGKTGLICAVASGSAAAVEAVLALDGTELEAQDATGDTAFDLAFLMDHLECIEALANAGCDSSLVFKALIAIMPCNIPDYNTPRREVRRQAVALSHGRQIYRAAEASIAAGRFQEALDSFKQTAQALKGSPSSLSMCDLFPAGDAWDRYLALRKMALDGIEQQHMAAEIKAKAAEAELMAMIEAEEEENTTAAGSAKITAKARRKKEKQQPHKQKLEPFQKALSPSIQPEPTSEMTAEKARKKKEKRKRQQQKKAAAKEAAKSSSIPTKPTSQVEQPGGVEMQCPAPSVGDREPEPDMSKEIAVPLMSQFTVEQLVAWLGSLTGLTEDTIKAVGSTFTEQDIDGEELEVMLPKTLRRILGGSLADSTTTDAAVEAILADRDLQVSAQQSADTVAVSSLQQLPEPSAARHADRPPMDFTCPLTLCLMKDPYTTQAGSTCEYHVSLTSPRQVLSYRLSVIPHATANLRQMRKGRSPFGYKITRLTQRPTHS
jgi:ankyrin repeat protein